LKRLSASLTLFALAPAAAAAPSAFSLGPVETYGTGTAVFGAAVRIADMNADGASDVVVAADDSGAGGGAILVFPQLADGTLGDPERFPFDGYSSVATLEVADLDGDGLPDVVLSGWGTGALVEYGTMFGGLDGPYTLFDSDLHDVTTGDVDQDGDLDILAVPNGPVGIYAFVNEGNGGFSARQLTQELYGTALAYGDVTGDGILDLVTAGIGWDWMLAVHAGRADGTFEAPTAWTDGRPSLTGSLAVADFDGDGALDATVADLADSDALLHVFPSGGGSARTYAGYERPGAMVAADVDGDGDADLVVAHPGRGMVSVHLQEDGGLAAGALYAVPAEGELLTLDTLAVGDVTDDGCADVVLADAVFGVLVLPGLHCGETIADADGDGVADAADGCPDVADPGQEDADGDGRGDACDPPADTGNPTDSGTETAEPPNRHPLGAGAGCGCATGEARAPLLGLAALLFLRRGGR
jgi:hypothetical protein